LLFFEKYNKREAGRRARFCWAWRRWDWKSRGWPGPCESKPGTTENNKAHGEHQYRGVLSFGYFSLDKQRKVPRFSKAKEGL